MADTTKIKTLIEPYIRNWLSKQFAGHDFEERAVQCVSGKSHRFDAVADDGSIVAAILCSRATTRTGRENTGGVRKALNDIGYLKEIPANVQKVLVFTDDNFCQLIRRRASRLGLPPIQVMVCKLAPRLEAELKEIIDRASLEQRAAAYVLPHKIPYVKRDR